MLHCSCHISNPPHGCLGTGTDPRCQRHDGLSKGRSRSFRTFLAIRNLRRSPSLVKPKKPLFPAFPNAQWSVPNTGPGETIGGLAAPRPLQGRRATESGHAVHLSSCGARQRRCSARLGGPTTIRPFDRAQSGTPRRSPTYAAARRRFPSQGSRVRARRPLSRRFPGGRPDHPASLRPPA